MQTTVLKGAEVLTFEGVKVIKNENGQESPIEAGTLSVIYFKELDCFILYLGDWDYALFKSLFVSSSSKTDMKARSYTFPTYGGYYTVKLNKIPNREAIINFETILDSNTTLTYQGDQDVTQEMLSSSTETTPKAGMFRKGFNMIANTLSKALTKTNKNLNMTQVRDINEIKLTDESTVSMYEINRHEVEKTILGTKDVVERVISSSAMKKDKEENETLGASEIPENKKEILDEIEKERMRQEEAQKTQEESKGRELEEKESKLQEGIEAKHEEKLLEDSQKEGRITQEEKVSSYERTVQENERGFEVERNRCEEREKQRMINNQRPEDVKVIEKTAMEDTDLKKREDLMTTDKGQEAELTDLEKQKDRIEELEHKEENLNEKEAKIFEPEVEIRSEEEETADLRQKEELAQKERIQARNLEDELTNLKQLKEGEILELEKQKAKFEVEAKLKEAEMREKEENLEIERGVLGIKEEEVQRRFEDVRHKEELIEREHSELQLKERELLETVEIVEEERRQFAQKKEEFRQIAEQRESELNARERLTEAEKNKLGKIRDQLQKEADLTEASKNDLEIIQNKILEDAWKRDKELTRREKLTEQEREELVLRENEVIIEIEKRLQELRELDRLTEEERREMGKRQQELVRMQQIRDVAQIKKIQGQHSDLYKQNVDLIESHKQMLEEINRAEEELLRPSEFDIKYRELMEKSPNRTQRTAETEITRDQINEANYSQTAPS